MSEIDEQTARHYNKKSIFGARGNISSKEIANTVCRTSQNMFSDTVQQRGKYQ